MFPPAGYGVLPFEGFGKIGEVFNDQAVFYSGL